MVWILEQKGGIVAALFRMPRNAACVTTILPTLRRAALQSGKSLFGRTSWQKRYYVLTEDATLRYFSAESSKKEKVRSASL